MSVAQKASITCAVIKGNMPLKFVWMKNQKELPNDDNIKVRDMDDISVLAIDPIKSVSGGNYTCVVSNSLGRDEHTARLIVKGNSMVLMII